MVTIGFSTAHQAERNRGNSIQSQLQTTEPSYYPSTEPLYSEMLIINLPTASPEYSIQLGIYETWIPKSSVESSPETSVQPSPIVSPLVQQDYLLTFVPSPEVSAYATIEPSNMEVENVSRPPASPEQSALSDIEGTWKPIASLGSSLEVSPTALPRVLVSSYDAYMVMPTGSFEPSLHLSPEPSYIAYSIMSTPTSLESFNQLDVVEESNFAATVHPEPMISVQATPDFSPFVHGDEMTMETYSPEPFAEQEADNPFFGLNLSTPADYPTGHSPEPSKEPVSHRPGSSDDGIHHMTSPKPAKQGSKNREEKRRRAEYQPYKQDEQSNNLKAPALSENKYRSSHHSYSSWSKYDRYHENYHHHHDYENHQIDYEGQYIPHLSDDDQYGHHHHHDNLMHEDFQRYHHYHGNVEHRYDVRKVPACGKEFYGVRLLSVANGRLGSALQTRLGQRALCEGELHSFKSAVLPIHPFCSRGFSRAGDVCIRDLQQCGQFRRTPTPFRITKFASECVQMLQCENAELFEGNCYDKCPYGFYRKGSKAKSRCVKPFYFKPHCETNEIVGDMCDRRKGRKAGGNGRRF